MGEVNSGNASSEMPRYKCHKKVWALKIEQVRKIPEEDYEWTLTFAEAGFSPITVGEEFFGRHNPNPGDYLVTYEDGYRSISPAKAFEDGYTRVI